MLCCSERCRVEHRVNMLLLIGGVGNSGEIVSTAPIVLVLLAKVPTSVHLSHKGLVVLNHGCRRRSFLLLGTSAATPLLVARP